MSMWGWRVCGGGERYESTVEGGVEAQRWEEGVQCWSGLRILKSEKEVWSVEDEEGGLG